MWTYVKNSQWWSLFLPVTPHISIHSPVYDDLESRCIGTKLTSLSVMSAWLFTRFWAPKFPALSLPSEPGSRSSVWTLICDRPLQFQHLILGLLTLDRYSVIRSCMIRPCAAFGAIKFSFLLLRKTEEFYLKKSWTYDTQGLCVLGVDEFRHISRSIMRRPTNLMASAPRQTFARQ